MKLKNNTILLSIFIVTLFCNIGCNQHDSKKESSESTSQSYQETKMTLEEKEKSAPLDFLTIDAAYHKNFWGEFVIEGTIRNSATIAIYKDVVIEVSFYSKTDSFLGSKKQVIYEFFSPGKLKQFKIKLIGFKGAVKIGWKIVGASTK